MPELKTLWEPGAQGRSPLGSRSTRASRPSTSSCSDAGADSGTFDYFTEAIVGKAKASRGEYTASEDDNVLVQGV